MTKRWTRESWAQAEAERARKGKETKDQRDRRFEQDLEDLKREAIAEWGTTTATATGSGWMSGPSEWDQMVERAQQQQSQAMRQQVEQMQTQYSARVSSGIPRNQIFDQRVDLEGRVRTFCYSAINDPPREPIGSAYDWLWDGRRLRWERHSKSGLATNQLKATIHKAGHFPVSWMMEAFERAEQSEKVIRIELEKEGVVVIGQEGDNYETHTLPWVMMEKAEVNPVILGIEAVEKHLDTLARLKRRVKVA